MNHKQNETLGGIVLISMGVAAMLSFSDVDILGLSPWLMWGLLIPVIGGLSIVYQQLQANGGRIDGRFLRQNLWVFFPLVIAAFFIFNLNWSLLGGIVFIGIGLSLLLGQNDEKVA